MTKLTSTLVMVVITCTTVCDLVAQTKVTQLVIANALRQVRINPPSSGTGVTVLEFPEAPTGSKILLNNSTSGQTISGAITFTGPVTLGDDLSLTFGGSSGNVGDVLTSDGLGGATWQTPSGGGGGGGVPTSRTLTTTLPLTIGGGASADLSQNRTIAFDFSVANSWTGVQTFLQTSTQGDVLLASANAASIKLKPARRSSDTSISFSVASGVTYVIPSTAFEGYDVINITNSSAGARNISLETGSFTGQRLILHRTAVAGNFTLLDSGNQQLISNWTNDSAGDNISLMWNGSQWIELGRVQL